MMMAVRSVLALLLLTATAVDSKTSSWTKVRRVKAGKVYDDHEAAHIVVNKVGYVTATILLLLLLVYNRCYYFHESCLDFVKI